MTDAIWALLAVVGLTWLGVMPVHRVGARAVWRGVWLSDREDKR